MSRTGQRAVVVILAIILIQLAASLILRKPQLKKAARSEAAATGTNHAALPQTRGMAANGFTSKELTLIRMAQALSVAPDVPARKAQLAALRHVLMEHGTNDAVTAIRRLLSSKTNMPTGLGFRLDARGNLDEPPSFRVFLLDQLGQIAPAGAAEEARGILQSKDSPDEWAVSLRNLARGDSSPSARELLLQKTEELLRYQAWQQDASTGYLEAFDTAVYLGNTNLIPALADLVRKRDNQAVAHAAFLALDRLVINQPADILALLESQPELLQGREQTRANYFGRADVRDPAQRAILEQYLLDSRVAASELGQFVGLYPNANYMVSHNLLTPSGPPDRGPLPGRDAESLRVLDEWLADPRFSAIRPQLENARQRLQDFANQAAAVRR